MIFQKRRELIQEVKHLRRLLNQALEEIEDLRTTSYSFQVALEKERAKNKPAKKPSKKVAKVQKELNEKTTKKKVVKKTNTRKGVKSK